MADRRIPLCGREQMCVETPRCVIYVWIFWQILTNKDLASLSVSARGTGKGDQFCAEHPAVVEFSGKQSDNSYWEWISFFPPLSEQS